MSICRYRNPRVRTQKFRCDTQGSNERYKYYFDGGGMLIIILFPLVEIFYRALKTLASLVLKAVEVGLVLNCFILSI